MVLLIVLQMFFMLDEFAFVDELSELIILIDDHLLGVWVVIVVVYIDFRLVGVWEE